MAVREAEIQEALKEIQDLSRHMSEKDYIGYLEGVIAGCNERLVAAREMQRDREAD